MRNPFGSSGRGRREVALLRRQAHEVARVRTRDHAHQQRRIGHAARHRPGDAPHVGRMHRHAAERGLEARRCRNAWPAAAPSRRCRCRCAAARSRRPRRRPRRSSSRKVLRSRRHGLRVIAVQAGKPGGQHAEVRHGGLAEDHAAGLAHARRGRRIGGLRRRVLVRARADRRRIAARSDVLLDGDRHAVERRERASGAPARLGGARLLERARRAARGTWR